MRIGERTWIFWAGLIVVASALTILFSTLWISMFLNSILTNPRSVLQEALEAGMPPRSIVDSMRYYYWELLVPPFVGGVVLVLIGLLMMNAGTKRREQKLQSKT